MNKPLAAALALVFLVLAPHVRGADAKTEVQDLIEKIRSHRRAGNYTEADIVADLQEFDVLLAEHKNEKTADVADILYTKAVYRANLLGDYAKATAELQELKTNFPDPETVQKADELIAAVAGREKDNEIQRGLTVGTVFPDFQETSLEGQPISLSKERGKVVLVQFWATWCRPCVAEMPGVRKAYLAYHDQGFDIISINLDEDKDKLTGFLQKNQITWPQYFDGQGWHNKLARAYGVTYVPLLYLLGRDGRIIGVGLYGEALEEAVKTALATK